ncbi:signal peptidase I [Irregularibacter muris]|uniref:Signal peptidase I n=1 Tax=Irregularibacter muris TaxID=1796619 RepID=A0AAE3HFK3_9FIRM|nr:signal peptidase I [Irregularibacter muris]MCR1898129.1 signal peptidase I [Irregularibacter muris]
MKTKSEKNEWIEWLRTIIIAGIIAMIIKSFLFEPFEVRGSSMYPTLANKDRLVINKIEYLIHEPDYGDIIVFKYPADLSLSFIKRIVAKDGDTVEIKNNVVYINDKEVVEPYIPSNKIENFPKTKVPNNSYFVLGDNRNNSRDSRYRDVGFLTKENIIGKAIVKIWPLKAMKIIE